MRHLLRRVDRVSLRPLRLAGVAIGLAVASFAGAQTATDEFVAPSVAKEVQRLALLELRMQPSPTPDDYLIAYHTLRLAQLLVPDDVELARKIAQAAWATGETSLLTDATRDVVRLDPSDTVAQLRLIVAGITRYQTVEERLAAYERFLGPAGERLRPEVRSRLALDAALLWRERGNNEKFVHLLQQAIELDGSNKAAAQLGMTYVTSTVPDPSAQFEMLLQVLYADPIDPQVQLTIGRTLANLGAMKSSERYMANAISLFQNAGSLPSGVDLEWLSLRFQNDGPAVVLRALNGDLQAKRNDAQARREYAMEQQLPLDDLVEPEQVRLSPDQDKLRILCAMALGDDETLRGAMTDLDRSLSFMIDQLRDLNKLPPGYTPDQAAATSLSMLAEIQLYRLWSNLDVDKVEPVLTPIWEAAKQNESLAQAVQPLEPWWLLRQGKPAEAVARAEEIGPGLGRLGQIAQALALEQLGRTTEAAQLLVDSSHFNGLSGASAWSRHHAKQLDISISPLSPAGVPLDAMARDVPRFIDDMVKNPIAFMDLRISAGERTKGAADRFVVTIELKNLAPIPLGVGSDRPINSRILLQPHRDNNGAYFARQLFPEVVELNRRLRLDPLETMRADIPVDLGANGLVMSLNALRNHRLRWRALQGFVIGALGSFRPGPSCLSVETDAVEVRGLSTARFSDQETGVAIATGLASVLPALLDQTRAILLAWPVRSTPRPQATVDLLVRSLTQRLESGTALERALMLAAMPTAELDVNMLSFDVAAQGIPVDEDFAETPHARLVESLVLLTRVSDPESDLFEHARQSQWPELVELADLLQARLREGRPCVAKATTLDAYFPPAMVGPRQQSGN